MKSNTQNAKIEAITEKTLVLGIDVGSKMHYARAFDYRGIEHSKKPFKFSNTEAGFVTFKEWILALVENSFGKHKGKTTISRRGRKRLRYLLFEAAMSLVVKNPEFRELHNYYTKIWRKMQCV